MVELTETIESGDIKHHKSGSCQDPCNNIWVYCIIFIRNVGIVKYINFSSNVPSINTCLKYTGVPLSKTVERYEASFCQEYFYQIKRPIYLSKAEQMYGIVFPLSTAVCSGVRVEFPLLEKSTVFSQTDDTADYKHLCKSDLFVGMLIGVTLQSISKETAKNNKKPSS